jgi:hypothetical protein
LVPIESFNRQFTKKMFIDHFNDIWSDKIVNLDSKINNLMIGYIQMIYSIFDPPTYILRF